MNDVVLIDRFIAHGSPGPPVEFAVSIGAGAVWMDVYDMVTTQNGRYVQGGGCATVGVAGLIQSGGFSSFSKNFGMAACSLLEAEIVTADGSIRIANPWINPDLFWAIKGGGGGSWGVVTRVTLRTHPLPEWFGGVHGTIQAASDEAFRLLIGTFMTFYRECLFNPHWGETISLGKHNSLRVSLESQGLNKRQILEAWQPFFDWLSQSPSQFTIRVPFQIDCTPARHYWDGEYLSAKGDASIARDPRPGTPAKHIWWTDDQEQVGEFWYGYESLWLAASLLRANRITQLVEALFAASRKWSVGLHFNKGLAGAPSDVAKRLRDTATNPAVGNAFALAIISGGAPPAYPGCAKNETQVDDGRSAAQAINSAMDELRKIAPDNASYISESNYFQQSWQQSFWGEHYARLRRIKSKYDPDGLFFVRHGVGSELWSDDGFLKES